jgi:D-3-phosphoglycerate dehydrogenase
MHIAIVDIVDPLLAERLTQAGHRCSALHGLTDAELAPRLSDVDGIVVRNRLLPADLLAHAPGLRVVGRVGSGLENIALDWCTAHHVQVLNAPEGNRDGVGETCVMLVLALLKHLPRASAAVRQGQWPREANRGRDLAGKTVGIIGYGHMGSAFATKLAGFDVQVLAHDKYITGFGGGHVTECTLDHLLAHSDVISLHLPLNDTTRHIADAAFFGRLGRPVWFLNTARGPLVRTTALLDALDDGRVIGAGLDVLEFETPDLSRLDPSSDPATLQRLLAHDRVIITPHIAGVTHEGRVKMAQVLADKILRAFPHVRP